MARILFIEDAAYTTRSLVEELEELGHIVIEVSTGIDALRAIQETTPEFDVVILDIMLPRGSYDRSFSVNEDVSTGEMGLEILRLFREELQIPTPVIVLSAVIDAGVKSRVQDYGIVTYLNKPVSLNKFIEAVNEALA